MENTINQSFSEVYDIINHLEIELYNKIPKGFIKMVEQNRDKNYEFYIDYSIDINKQKLLHETRVILSLIYRDYLCSPKEREKLIEQDELELKQHEEQLQEKFNYDNLFKNKRETTLEKSEEKNQELIVYDESFIRRIFNRILKFFHLK